MKGVCEYHRSEAVMAEELTRTVRADGAVCTRTQLRCTECGRARGIRFTIVHPEVTS